MFKGDSKNQKSLQIKLFKLFKKEMESYQKDTIPFYIMTF